MGHGIADGKRMKVARTKKELADELRRLQDGRATIGLVPTMGALHGGHLSLLYEARATCDVVVMSIFVNPLQFGEGEDFEAYPRDEERDLEHAAAAGVDVAFVPAVEEMYPPERTTVVKAPEVGRPLEGEARPGHFDGVCTVVAALFNIVGCDLAFFGQKDAQQVAVVKRMVEDLSYPCEIVVCPTVREPDGLAISSRNAYLSAEERTQATALYEALDAGRREFLGEPEKDGDREEKLAAAEKAMWKVLEGREGVFPEYARAVDPDTFGTPAGGRPVLLAVAARLGSARLIDNLLVE
jgi:pantoate--beta-alanine ligase